MRFTVGCRMNNKCFMLLQIHNCLVIEAVLQFGPLVWQTGRSWQKRAKGQVVTGGFAGCFLVSTSASPRRYPGTLWMGRNDVQFGPRLQGLTLLASYKSYVLLRTFHSLNTCHFKRTWIFIHSTSTQLRDFVSLKALRAASNNTGTLRTGLNI